MIELRTLFAFATLVLASVACGGTDTSSVANDVDSRVAEVLADSTLSDEQAELVEDLVNNAIEEAENPDAAGATGSPSATMTVGDQTFDFGTVLCSLSIPEEGQQSAGSSISAFGDDTKFSFTTSQFGDFVAVTDLEFGNHALDFAAVPDSLDFTLDEAGYRGTADFVDNTTEGAPSIPGNFSGSCE